MSQTLKIADKTVVTTTTTTTRYVDDPDGPPCRREEKTIPFLDEDGKPVICTFEPSDEPQVQSFDLKTKEIVYARTRLIGFRASPILARGTNDDGSTLAAGYYELAVESIG